MYLELISVPCSYWETTRICILSRLPKVTEGKHEATLEFHSSEEAPVSLIEMRFHIPNTAAEGEEDPVKVCGGPRFPGGLINLDVPYFSRRDFHTKGGCMLSIVRYNLSHNSVCTRQCRME